MTHYNPFATFFSLLAEMLAKLKAEMQARVAELAGELSREKARVQDSEQQAKKESKRSQDQELQMTKALQTAEATQKILQHKVDSLERENMELKAAQARSLENIKGKPTILDRAKEEERSLGSERSPFVHLMHHLPLTSSMKKFTRDNNRCLATR